MPTNIAALAEPRVWIGCLACCSAGHLTGEWFDALHAAEVASADIHGDSMRGPAVSHEELWCLDTDSMPGPPGEMSPQEAFKRVERLQEVPEHERLAFAAWWAFGDHVEDSGGLPVYADFEERFCGTWESFREYAERLSDEIDLLGGMPDDIARYFDWQSWVDDLAVDYSTEPAAGGDVYVYRIL